MDDSSAWTINTGILVNGANAVGPTAEIQDSQFQISAQSRNVCDAQDPLEPIQPAAVFDMRDTWFTKIQRSVQRSEESLRNAASRPQSRISTSHSVISPREPELVDEECRRGLTQALVYQFPQDHLLPSPEFLVRQIFDFYP
jgi:hypothetical protein